MFKKMKKVVLALALVSCFAISLNPTDANANQIDPKPALGTSSTSYTFDY